MTKKKTKKTTKASTRKKGNKTIVIEVSKKMPQIVLNQIKRTLEPTAYKRFHKSYTQELRDLRTHFRRDGWPLRLEFIKDEVHRATYGGHVSDLLIYKLIVEGYRVDFEADGVMVRNKKESKVGKKASSKARQ